MRALTALGLLTLAPLLLTGCSDDDEDASLSDDFSVAAALHEVPAGVVGCDDEGTFVTAASIERAEEYAEVERPDADSEELAPWAMALSTEQDVFVPGPDLFRYSALSEDTEKQLGWSVVDVDSFVECVGFAAARVDDVELNPDLPEEDDITLSAEGEIGSISATADSVPRGPFPFVTGMVLDGDRLAWSRSAEALGDWRSGDGDTLADDADLAALAAALDEHDVYSAALQGGRVTPNRPPASGSPGTDHDAVAVGWAFEDGGPQIWIAWKFADSDIAEDAVGDLEDLFSDGTSLTTAQPLTDLLELEEIEADGDVVVARVTSTDGFASRPYIMLQSRDIPFANR